MKKIDVSKFDHLTFNVSAHIFYDRMPQLYKSGNYTEYIKFQCLGSFFSDCNFLFSMRNNSVPSCYMFPEGGREQTYQAFKKLGLADKVKLFNESHANFYKTLNPDFERIVSILSEHRNRWRTLVKECKAVDLIEKLQSLYKMSKDILGSDSVLYELYFIYENEYLRNQFERFYSAIDFYQWWDCEAIRILNCS